MRDIVLPLAATVIVLSAALPAPRSRRDYTSETAGIATLRNLWTAQDLCREAHGRFGGFAELSGAERLRDAEFLSPSLLSTAFRAVEDGIVQRSGYRFRIYLAGPGARPVAERRNGGFAPGTIDEAARFWCAYAWPASRAHGDMRSFVVNQDGDILATSGYSADAGPAPLAAFTDSTRGLAGDIAVRSPGSDGRVWKRAG